MMCLKLRPGGMWLVLCLSALTIASCSTGLAAQDWSELLMTNEQRDLIERQRQQYFESLLTDKETLPAAVGLSFNLDSNFTLRVSAIIKRADGLAMAQINGVMFNQNEHKNGIHIHRINSQSVSLSVNGKRGQAYINVEYQLADWPKSPVDKVKLVQSPRAFEDRELVEARK